MCKQATVIPKTNISLISVWFLYFFLTDARECKFNQVGPLINTYVHGGREDLYPKI